MMALTINNYLQVYGSEHTELWNERKVQITASFGHQMLSFILKTWKFLREKKLIRVRNLILSPLSVSCLSPGVNSTDAQHISALVICPFCLGETQGLFRLLVLDVRLDPTSSNQIKPDPA